MFGLLLTVLSGGWFGKWLDENLGGGSPGGSTVEPLGFVGSSSPLVISDNMWRFLSIYEGFRSKPYQLKGENFYTIGIGSTRIFSKDGKTSRPVLKTDVVTRDQAEFHAKMYYSRKGSVKESIDALIKQYNVKLNQRFYDMLCQVSYASGSFHRLYRSNYVAMLQKANGSNDVEMLGELLKNTWIGYCKAYANYNINGLAWSRRAFASSQYIKGRDWSMNLAVNTIKKPY